MPGLVPGIHALLGVKEGVDGRHKPGHDERWALAKRTQEVSAAAQRVVAFAVGAIIMSGCGAPKAGEQMPKKLVVDFHAHILEPQVFKASAGRTVVTGFGAIAEPPRTPGSRRDIWFKQMMDPEAHLEGLDKMGVDVSVISSSTVIQNTAWADSGTGLALDRRCNDMIADWVRRYPGRFVGTFTMPLQDPYLALQEMERAV
jgi:hypothetical protein